MSIPDPFLPKPEGEIPEAAAKIPEKIEPETSPVQISFSRYNTSECEIEQGQMSPYAMNALRAIKNIGTHVRTLNDFTSTYFESSAERVINAGEYKKLFSGLDDPEIDMREVKISGKVPIRSFYRTKSKEKMERVTTGRLFFYVVSQTLYMVAIRANHYETDKMRS